MSLRRKKKMSEFKEMDLKKKDEKEINGFLNSFKKGLVIGFGILVLFFFVLIIIEILKK